MGGIGPLSGPWAARRASVGGPGLLVGPLWAVMGRSWGLCWRSWVALGAYGGALLGAMQGVLAAKWPKA